MTDNNDIISTEVEPHLADFSKSQQAHFVNSRTCTCGRVHVTFHNENKEIFAHADFSEIEALEGFGNAMLHYAKIMKNYKKEENKNDV